MRVRSAVKVWVFGTGSDIHFVEERECLTALFAFWCAWGINKRKRRKHVMEGQK